MNHLQSYSEKPMEVTGELGLVRRTILTAGMFLLGIDLNEIQSENGNWLVVWDMKFMTSQKNWECHHSN